MRRALCAPRGIGGLLFAVFLLAAAAVPAAAQPASVTGRFHVIWGDGPPGSGTTVTRFVVIDDHGRSTEVLGEDLVLRFDALRALNGKRVRVAGRPIAGPRPAVQADAVELVDGESRMPASPTEVAGPAAAVAAAPAARPFVTILCRFADSPGTPRSVADVQALMGSAHPGMDHYWREVSYGTINLTGSVVVGWYNLPQPRSYYVYDVGGDGSADLDSARITNDCTAAADADVFFPDFYGINLMFNDDLDCCAHGGSRTLNRDGQTRVYSVTWLPPWAQWPREIAHEMGHGFGLPHSSGPYSATYDSPWDVMSSGGMCASQHPLYGCLPVHTISYHKDLLGVIPPSRKFMPSRGTHTFLLERLARSPESTGYLMAQLPIVGSRSYTLEARRFTGYDSDVPGEAIVIHEVEPSRFDGRPAHVVDVDGNRNPSDAAAMWTPGETFSDAANGIRVSVGAATATGFQVTVDYDPPPILSTTIVGRGFIFADPSGMPTCSAPTCHETYPAGTRLALWPEPEPGWLFDGWSGACTTRAWGCAVTMSADRELTATFVPSTVGTTIFRDDMDAGNGPWVGTENTWAHTTATAHSRTYSRTDSPGGNYGNNANAWTFTHPLDFRHALSVTLTFWHRYDFAAGDFGILWALVGDPLNYEQIASFTGTATDWTRVSVDLSAFVGQPIVRIAFQVVSDASGTADGWYIDDVGVTARRAPAVSIVATDATATEAGLTPGLFTVTRTGSTSAPLTVSYTVAGTATAGNDYTALPGTVTIPAGASSSVITVSPVADTRMESTETVVVTIAANAAYTVLAPSSAKVSILSDEVVTITAIDATATEAGATTARFRVTRTGSSAAPLTVFYAVRGTATGGSDYAALPGSLTIPARASSAALTVTPINDGLMEDTESVTVVLAARSTYTLGTPSRATVTITSDEVVTITATDGTATEAGRTTGRFRVSRSGSMTAPLTVFYTIAGTATSGSDYVAVPNRVTIPAGVSAASIVITPINDALVEGTETVTLTLAARTTYTLGAPRSATVSIVSDE
jgi:hypothetical protein